MAMPASIEMMRVLGPNHRGRADSLQCNRNQRIGDDEPVGRERPHPAINIKAARAAFGKHGDRKERARPVTTTARVGV